MTTAQVINNDIMFEAGCVMELTNFLNAHMVYVLAGVASIAVMGNHKIEKCKILL